MLPVCPRRRRSRRPGPASSAIAAPMPRAAPVTSGDLAGQRAIRVVADRAARRPIRTTWPSTYADRAERKKRSVESSCSCAPERRTTRLTVAPRLHLLADATREALEGAPSDLRSGDVRELRRRGRPRSAPGRGAQPPDRRGRRSAARSSGPRRSTSRRWRRTTSAFGRISPAAAPSVGVLKRRAVSRSRAWIAFARRRPSPIAPNDAGPASSGCAVVAARQRGRVAAGRAA